VDGSVEKCVNPVENCPKELRDSKMTLYGLDPGTTQSALITVRPAEIRGDILANAAVLWGLRQIRDARDQTDPLVLVIEQIEGMGMAVGREVFETVCWAGRFCEAWESHAWPVVWVTRRAVKLHLCGTSRAKDTNVRQALLDRYGGKAATKKGGPLFGMKSHLWSALALAVTYREQQDQERRTWKPMQIGELQP
jgi:hypothetical protein